MFRAGRRAVPCLGGPGFKPVRKIVIEDDDPDSDESVEAPSMTESDYQRTEAIELVDMAFHKAKLRLTNPRRWVKLFISTARMSEGRLDVLREATIIAAALDDYVGLQKIKDEVSSKLWSYWGFDTGIVSRAIQRTRPEAMEILPELEGQAYPPVAEVWEKRRAMTHLDAPGSKQAVFAAQRGEAILKPLRKAFDQQRDINMLDLNDELHCAGAGPWKSTVAAAVGINYGPPVGDYALWRPIHFVCGNTFAKNTALEAFNLLVSAMADLRAVDAHGNTALHVAAMRGHDIVVGPLLENGVPIDVLDAGGCSSLLVAARTRHSEIVRSLVAYALPDESVPGFLETQMERDMQRFDSSRGVLLHEKIAKGDVMGLKELVQVGDGRGAMLANIEFPDSQGRRPLHMAVTSVSDDGRAGDMLRNLCGLRADVNARNFHGETGLHYAARMGRGWVAVMLLRLKANPNMTDVEGRTPLMVAAASMDDPRTPIEYDGIVVNPPIKWHFVERVLKWHGLGDPPRPKDIPPKKENTDERTRMKMEEFFGGGRKKPQPKKGAKQPDVLTETEIVQLRAGALIELGFEDQHIFDEQGRVNRGDRLQLYKTMFNHSTRKVAEGELDTEQERELQHCSDLWHNLAAPMLRMEHSRQLTDRQSEFLHYILITLLGKRGQVFGVLATMGIGTKPNPLPTWENIVHVIKKGSISDRMEKLRLLCFCGNKPRIAHWVGSAWAFDDYPRNPDAAPWDAFEYVDRETAVRLNQRPDPEPTEAFKSGNIDIFEPPENVTIGMPRRVPNRAEGWQLMNRLFVNAPTGKVGFVEEHMRVLGERLLCPLLDEAIKGLASARHAKKAEKHREMLRYIAQQMECPNIDVGMPRDWFRLFKDQWKELKASGLKQMANPVPEVLTRLDPAMMDPSTPRATRKRKRKKQNKLQQTAADQPLYQASFIGEHHVAWLQKRLSVQAYIELTRCGAITCSDDFVEVVVALAARTKDDFAESFWWACFGLLLWGQGKRMRDVFGEELQRRMPPGVQLNGPTLQSRPELLLRMATPREEDLVWGSGAMRHRRHDPNFPQNVHGFADVLRAELVCPDEDAMVRTYCALCGIDPERAFNPHSAVDESPKSYDNVARPDSGGSVRTSASGLDSKPSGVGLPEITMNAVRVVNDFNPPRSEFILPAAASILVTVLVSMAAEAIGAPRTEQLAEVELLFPTTKEARWLTEVLKVSPQDIPKTWEVDPLP